MMDQVALSDVASPPLDGIREGDQTIRATAIRMLHQSGYRCLGELRCEVLDGVIELHGRVPSFYLKQMAQAIVLKVEKVKAVQNCIEVAVGE